MNLHETVFFTIVALFAPTVLCDGDVVGKLVVGYQGWFYVQGDNSPMNYWFHWVHNSDHPYAGHTNVDLYPDTREYDHLYDTDFANLGNGQPAQLFSSWDDQTVDTHFRWMQENNIDVAALQRFAGDSFKDFTYRDQLNGVAQKVRAAAENHDRKFYIMWDITNWDSFATQVIEDLDTQLRPLNLFDSPAYAHQDGKPVVCVWGFGFTDRPDDPSGALGLINNLKAEGLYVIGGVPTNWREGNGDSRGDFRDVYLSLDMVQPWSVGRFGDVNGAANYKNQLEQDFNLCNENNIEFQPVLFAGFSWTNMHDGSTAPNEIPRQHGDFMWQQFVNIRELGITNAYVAMFDEYDEGTAIAKAAEDSSMIPTDQYFLTLDADGVHVSADFYLRLVGDGNRMMQGQIPLTQEHPTKHVP